MLSFDPPIPIPRTVTPDTTTCTCTSDSTPHTSAPGTSTPGTSTASAPPTVVLEHHSSTRLHLDLPPHLHRVALALRRDFVATPPADNKAVLLAQFAAFVLRRIEDHDHDDQDALVELLGALRTTFHRQIGGGEDVHPVAASLRVDPAVKQTIVSTFTRVDHLLGPSCTPSPSGLLKAAQDDRARLLAVFGGQGHDTYLGSLASLHDLYQPLVEPLLWRASTHLQDLIAREEYRPYYPKGLDFVRWITDPESPPDGAYLTSAPVSFPLIGVLQLASFCVIARVLRLTPRETVGVLCGASGHSQGIIIAAFVAASSDWASFHSLSSKALSLLLSIGVRSQEVFPPSPAPPSLAKDAADHGEGSPSPMLSVRHLPLSAVQALVDQLNAHLSPDEAIEVGLHNGPTNFVLVGPPTSLHAFNALVRAIKASPGDEQTRMPFDKRKPHVANAFLPVSAPFHSSYLSVATSFILQDAEEMGIEILGSDLCCPVYATTSNAADLSTRGNENIVPELVRLVTEQPLHWANACTAPRATHVLDFGPGRGGSGAGGLVHALTQGRGVRVLLAGELEGSGANFGGTAELAQRRLVAEHAWGLRYAPRVVRTSGGKSIVSTKMSKLLGLPPVMIAGMTPTTCSVDFVAAAMCAGFHVEFATGGYHDPAALEGALRRLADVVPPGRGITCNLIYANPTALRWQKSLLRRLNAEEGLPIEGLTFGAGVPSLDVANDYIQTFPGLKHIGFKPGNLNAINQVLAISDANPRFPIVLQWTGGRGGGHHSFEDFHEPMARAYSSIRRRENIVLVAGSGMGDADGSFPYLTGEWSRKLHLPPMPFDGILLGSRIMVAKEAKTSPAAKRVIVASQGVDDAQWTKTYAGAAGGVITVVSEMGEPIHKLATDGVKLWAELDKTIFSISDKAKRAQILKEKRDYIIRRLNSDYHKVWFGMSKSRGQAAGLEEMTYSEVIARLVELTFISHQQRWIDESFRQLAYDFVRHAASRFISCASQTSAIPSLADLDSPESCVHRLFAAFPRMHEDLMSYQDVQHFLALCRRKGQKPVPFVPALDEHFETWFKKDSLWQSEDLDAVIDQDVRRVCILQGPVAVQHSTKVDEPIKDILDGFHLGYINKILATQSTVPQVVECLGLPEDPYVDARLAEIGGKNGDWRQSFFTSRTIVQNKNIVENPIRRLLNGKHNMFADVGPERIVLSVVEDESTVQAVRVEAMVDGIIEVRILGNMAAASQNAELLLKFRYHPECGYAPIHEIMEGRTERVRDFYRQVWLSNDQIESRSIHDEYYQGPSRITAAMVKQFSRAVEYPDMRLDGKVQAPMDYSIVAAWKPLMEPLLAHDIQGDLLDLVHLSNSFRITPGARPLVEDDVVEIKSRVTTVVNQASGKMVEVMAHILRDDQLVVQITSQFLYRGKHSDNETSFQVTDELPMEVEIKTPVDLQVLQAKEWLQLNGSSASTLHVGKKLIFRLRTECRKSRIRVTGDVEAKFSLRKSVRIGAVDYDGPHSGGNPVGNYLKRHGGLEHSPVMLANPTPLGNYILEMPLSNKAYAKASLDLNPIHLSPALSQYLGLPDTITHGMHTSTRVRLLIERHLCESEAERFKSFRCSFVGMVIPGDRLKVVLQHVGMVAGRKIIKVEVMKEESDEVVLVGEAEIEEAKTAFVFTGQGSQQVGMGMDLYATSEAARDIWDRADKHFLENYGFLITDIVKNNPKKLVIHFGGKRGRQVRQRYMDLTFLDVAPDGTATRRHVFPDINESSTSHTFSSPEGLLSATQFTQPALTLMEIAAFRDLQRRGLVSNESYFAGHSLGEYSALCAMVDVCPIEDLMSIVFYRGLTMQFAVKRDEMGRSDFAMVAVNPSRMPKVFDGATLKLLVQEVASATSCLVEVVNYNVEGQQYVCAGHRRALKCLGDVLDHAYADRSMDLQAVAQRQALGPLIQTMLAQQQQRGQEAQADGFTPLQRGKATIPLPGIDVPFHSSYLHRGVAPFRHHLTRFLRREAIDPDLLRAKYVPNLTAKPFDLSREYFEEVLKLTGSDVVRDILDKWDEYEEWVPGKPKPVVSSPA